MQRISIILPPISTTINDQATTSEQVSAEAFVRGPISVETPMESSQDNKDLATKICNGTIVQNIIQTSKLPANLTQKGIDLLTQCVNLKVRSKVISLLEDQSKFFSTAIIEKSNC